jgi:ParB family chromosome partitioning protein
MIAPVTVRPMPTGRYELVSGERRLKAAAMAAMREIPAVVRSLTDDEVREIQLSENLHREDPHPLHESFAVSALLKAGKTIEEIALRLAKSKTFVYSRIKLAALIEPLQGMFLAGKCSTQDAFEIATLAEPSQQELFDALCTNWRHKDFRIYNLSGILSSFKYDLKKAPFSTTDKKLIPGAADCTGCPFNSATLETLFPEHAQKATCTNKGCFNQKCIAHMTSVIARILTEQAPDALLLSHHLPQEVKTIIDETPEINALPRLGRYDVTGFSRPVLPDKEDFMESSSDDAGDETLEFDEDAYNEALEEYHADLEEHEANMQSVKTLLGLYISGFQVELIHYSMEKRTPGKPNVTAKGVQEAIKAGTATRELLQQEIQRIQEREKRAKELDREKIQLELHRSFLQQLTESGHSTDLTVADRAAAKLLVYQSLEYSVRQQVNQVLFPGVGNPERLDNESSFATIAALTDEQYSYLIRMAVIGKPDSKYPHNATAHFLRMVAGQAGLDIAAIEKAQQVKADARQLKLPGRIKELEERIKSLDQPTIHPQ